ncbi:MAG: aldolase/citrate lyase family protein [Rhodospirillaceae bacterium]
MIRDNPVKKRLAEGGRVLGCWLNMVSPIAAEIVGMAGYDFVMIDHEHGPGSFTDAIGLMQAIAAGGACPILRVPWNDTVYIKRALDSGVEGLMIPAVGSAEEARAAVAACRYPPAGVRGSAYGSVRASGWGLYGEQYRDRTADTLLIICQIETVAGVESIAEIAAVPGVDVLFIGPYDLSGAAGALGRFDHPDVGRLIDRAERAILDSGLCYGSIPSPARSLSRLLDVGCRMVIAGSDTGFVRRGAAAEVEAFHKLAGDRCS